MSVIRCDKQLIKRLLNIPWLAALTGGVPPSCTSKWPKAVNISTTSLSHAPDFTLLLLRTTDKT